MCVIFHIDVNSAYLSWTAVEQLKNGKGTDLREIPSIIGGDRKASRGVVLAKSVPAKKYGIRTGEPVVNAFRKCPDLVIEQPDHKMYKRYSDKLMEFLRGLTPDIEQVSVDECYMDFARLAGRFRSPVEAAFQIKGEIYQRFGFTVNIGVSSVKVLAKMASDFAKPNRVHTLFPEEIQVKMWPLPLAELYMAGHSSVDTLKKLEIYTIGDLARADLSLVELHLKSHGRRLWEFANGIDGSRVEPEQAEAKGIGNSTTLARDAVTEEEAREVLGRLAKSVGRRLRAAGQRAGSLTVEIKYYDFGTSSHQCQLVCETNSDRDIYEEAVRLFQELWDGRPIRLLGIRSSKLAGEAQPKQLSLFDIEYKGEEERRKDKKQEQLDRALDKIRQKYGAEAVMKGKVQKKE